MKIYYYTEGSADNGSTLYALAESTRLAWERVKEKYSRDPTARTANLRDVGRGYRVFDPLSSRAVIRLVSIILGVILLGEAYRARGQLAIVAKDTLKANIIEIAIMAVLLVGVVVVYNVRRMTAVYLLDFTTFAPPRELETSAESFMKITRECGAFSEESAAFQERLLGRAGIGERAAFPESIVNHVDDIAASGGDAKGVCNMHSARLEAQQVIFGCLDDLFEKNRMDPKEVDILIVNCSLFNPTPSLSAMVVNNYRMKSSILTYNLAGMGCSAGLIAVDLAKDLLQVHKNCNCIIVSTENITQNWYLGAEKSMLITNVLFRMGGAAVLLSNKRGDRRRARYELLHTVRTHRGADDLAYDSIFQMEDKRGIRGVKLSKNIMDVAGEALKKNVTTLAPLVFPLTVHVAFGFYLFKKKVLKIRGLPPFVPDFHRAFQHFCIHTGGRAVLDVMEKALSLSVVDMEPSRFALRRYGNTSSPSVWYELEHIEKKGRMKRGDRIWQMTFGSGFKCNSAVWQSLKNVPACPEGLL